MQGDVSNIPATTLLKEAKGADDSVLFPPFFAGIYGGGDYRTDENEAQGIIDLAIQKYVDKADQGDARAHISLIPGMLLGFKDMADEDRDFYVWTEDVLTAIKRLNDPRQVNDYHIFIVNADQRPGGKPGVSHWLAIMVRKQKGAFAYTIFDSLNKPRLELQQNLAYLIEKYGKKMPAGKAAAAASRPVARPAAPATIACPACTFDNPAGAQNCEICNTQLPRVQSARQAPRADDADFDRRLEALREGVPGFGPNPRKPQDDDDEALVARLRALKR